jgi:hypothetical protein
MWQGNFGVLLMSSKLMFMKDYLQLLNSVSEVLEQNNSPQRYQDYHHVVTPQNCSLTQQTRNVEYALESHLESFHLSQGENFAVIVLKGEKEG